MFDKIKIIWKDLYENDEAEKAQLNLQNRGGKSQPDCGKTLDRCVEE